ncbi:hypothetical protein AB205_0005360 [Aquarana catesbeiana]|uniref:Natural cytotoxicity triggering receptor 3 n=1 Tax=Aquarana catesbeiana TaxID=8400 RepID=A0A2G9S8E0_AQUCT|nr:hypothetical protein AB205_0005360 [Aquarana catesbeiana]
MQQFLGFPTQRIHVSQNPGIVASEGNSVTLPCTYSISTGDYSTVGHYKWYRHEVRAGPLVSDKNKDFHGRVSIASVNHFINGRSAPLELHQLVQSDTGLYYCEVTLQLNGEISGHGNGTFLIVTAKKMPSYAVLNIVKIILLVLILLAAITLCCYIKGFSMRRRHDNCSSYNIHPSLPTYIFRSKHLAELGSSHVYPCCFYRYTVLNSLYLPQFFPLFPIMPPSFQKTYSPESSVVPVQSAVRVPYSGSPVTILIFFSYR